MSYPETNRKANEAESALKEKLVGAKVSGRARPREIGTIVGFDGRLMHISFEDGYSGDWPFPAAFERGFLSFEDEGMRNEFESISALREQVKAEEKLRYAEMAKASAEREKRVASALADRKKDEADRKKAEREKAKRERAEKKFEMLLRVAKSAGLQADDRDVALGWLAKHVTCLDARMPDFLEKRFVREFGDEKRTVVDSSKKTSGGFPMQWAFSGSVTVDSTDGMPIALKKIFGEEKTVRNSAFALALARDYGFRFGVAQNAKEIKRFAHDPKAFDVGFGS